MSGLSRATRGSLPRPLGVQEGGGSMNQATMRTWANPRWAWLLLTSHR
jgi:hypothetical protein